MSVIIGALYDGTGKRLDGDGPESVLDLLSTIRHKAFLNSTSQQDGTLKVSESDRFLLVPDEFATTKMLPVKWLLDLATLLTNGGCVGVMSENEASLVAVSRILSTPDALLASVRAAARSSRQHPPTPASASVGILTDGKGAYLDGDRGEAVAWQADDAMHYKAFINGGPEAASRANLLPTDRFYMMPADYEEKGALPVWIVGEIMKCVKLGGKIMVVAPSRAAFDRLLKMVSEPEKLYLAIEPPAGNA